jgi:hypothetical protein
MWQIIGNVLAALFLAFLVFLLIYPFATRDRLELSSDLEKAKKLWR